jgi:hypothetical protein
MATKCIAMAGDVKLPLKTFRFRVKDKTSGKKLDADAAAREVNVVESLQRRTAPCSQA